MADMFEYIKWRGDIRFSQVPPNEVDALILSALVYVRYEEVVSETLKDSMFLKDAAREILAKPDAEKRVRVKQDLELLKAAAESDRFGEVRLTFYKSVFMPEEETQFAAITYVLDDGSAFLVFRGTDSTLVGWKEDFNMAFQESIPAQRLAQEYVIEFATFCDKPLRLGGHSKGGNLAVYAASKCGFDIQQRIISIYNQDGPGFTGQMLRDLGYLEIVPKIRTYVPQASLVGMLFEREESYIVVKSRQLGIFQHDPYYWDIMGKGFVVMEERTRASYFMDSTIKIWLEGMSMEERNEFIDKVYELIMTGEVSCARDLVRPQNIVSYLKTLKMDENMRRIITAKLVNLVEAVRKGN